MNSILSWSVVITGLLLTACGGGGGAPQAASPQTSPLPVATQSPVVTPSPQVVDNGSVILTGGPISTVNATNDMVEALAFDRNGQILAAGTLLDVQAAAGEGTRTVNLQGAHVLPGFQDAHIHAIEAGINLGRCLLSEFGSLNRYEMEIDACAADQIDSTWFIGAGVSMPDLLTRTERPIDFLDQMIPDKPALILDNLGHGAWANSEALQMVGYDQMLNDPQGGLIDKDVNGDPNGIVYENAQQVLRTAALPPNNENMQANIAALRTSLQTLAQNGITSVSDAGGYWTRGHVEAWLAVENDGGMSVRASNALYLFPDREMEQQMADLLALKSETGRARFNQVKIYIDGIISQGTARLYSDYTTDPGVADVSSTGFEYFQRTALMSYAERLDAAGFSLHFHATGDRGAAIALDAIEAARTANGSNGNRHRITHLFLLDPIDLGRFVELNVTADVQLAPSAIAPATIAFYRSLLGERADRVIPVQSLLDSGANVTLSSDWDADELNPLIKIQRALNRQMGESITDVETAIRMLTINPARLLGHDDISGSIEVGKQADLVILDGNLLTQSTGTIDQLNVIATLVDGAPIYDPQGLFN